MDDDPHITVSYILPLYRVLLAAAGPREAEVIVRARQLWNVTPAVARERVRSLPVILAEVVWDEASAELLADDFRKLGAEVAIEVGEA